MARHRTTTPRHLQHARLGKHKAPRAVAGYKRSSVALLLLRLPGRDTQARSGTGHAKTIRWVLYGGEAFREAKNNNAQPAMADSTERRAQHPAASREAANQSIACGALTCNQIRSGNCGRKALAGAIRRRHISQHASDCVSSAVRSAPPHPTTSHPQRWLF